MRIITKQANPTQAHNDQWLVKHKGQHYIVSHIDNQYGNETLVFKSTPEGEITDFTEVAGGKYMSHQEAIKDLRETI